MLARRNEGGCSGCCVADTESPSDDGTLLWYHRRVIHMLTGVKVMFWALAHFPLYNRARLTGKRKTKLFIPSSHKSHHRCVATTMQTNKRVVTSRRRRRTIQSHENNNNIRVGKRRQKW